MTRTPRKAPTQSLRALAADLDMSRKKLIRLMRDGAPVQRTANGFRLDRAAFDVWLADRENPDLQYARAFHPQDIRHREKSAQADLLRAEADRERGALISVDDAAAEAMDELVNLRQQLLGLPAMTEAIEERLQIALADCLTLDRREAVAESPTVDEFGDDSWLEGAEPETLPMLSRGDPKYRIVLARAESYERALAELQERTIPSVAWFDHVREQYDFIRARLRQIPERVTDRDSAIAEVHAALHDLSGVPPEATGEER